jgi:large subunit ribosomal protein L35
MPKIKTHRSSAKRYKKRGSGSLKRGCAYGTHLLGHRSTKRKRHLRHSKSVASANSDLVKRALGMK